MPAVNASIIYVVDGDLHARTALKTLFESIGLNCEVFASPEEFRMAQLSGNRASCLILDVRSPEFREIAMVREQSDSPILITSAHADIRMAVKAIKGGAFDFFSKPYRDQELLEAAQGALMHAHAGCKARMQLRDLLKRYDSLTRREKQIMRFVCDGLKGKEVAHKLGIAENTVKVHRQNIMRKFGTTSFPALVRMSDAIAAIARHDSN